MIPTEIENTTATPDAELERPQPPATAIDPTDVINAFDGPPRSTDPLDWQVDVIAPSQQKPVLTQSCPTCGCRSARPRFSVGEGEFSLVTCLQCGTGQVHPRPTPGRIQGFYPAEYYGAEGEKFTPLIEFAVRKAATSQARRLTRGLPAGSRVLDVGCGRGTMLSALADQGFEAHGFEISDTARHGTDANTQVHVADSLPAAALPADHFDLVIVWHVLEHLPNPKEVLAEIQRILKPGGRIAVAVPNFSSWQAKWTGPSWFHLDLPRHLFHFPSACLRRLIADSGFEIEAERHFSLRQNPFGWVQSVLNRWDPRNRNGLYSLLKRRSRQPDAEPSRTASWLQRLAYWIGMPIGLGVSCLAAACRRGATVCITGKARPPAPNADTVFNASHRSSLDRLAAEHPECLPPNGSIPGMESLETGRR